MIKRNRKERCISARFVRATILRAQWTCCGALARWFEAPPWRSTWAHLAQGGAQERAPVAVAQLARGGGRGCQLWRVAKADHRDACAVLCLLGEDPTVFHWM
jgi:hypothetical protein